VIRLSVPFVLASTSPRRRQLVRVFGFPVQTASADVDETIHPGELADAAVQRLATDKARSVAGAFPGSLVLGADTVVVCDGVILGKPTSPSDAREMLSLLSGREHVVHTGMALVHAETGRVVSAVEQTYVTMDELSAAEVAAYVATGSPLDKAGAYGIQDDTGAILVKSIRGDFYTVMGLPLNRLFRLIPASFPDLVVS